MPSSSKNRPKNRPGTARTTVHLKCCKTPHFCLKVREIAKNGTKAHPPKNRVFSSKTTPEKHRCPPAQPTINQKPTSNNTIQYPMMVVKSSKHPPERQQSVPNRTKPARFCRSWQIVAQICSKVQKNAKKSLFSLNLAKSCTKLQKTPGTRAPTSAPQH